MTNISQNKNYSLLANEIVTRYIDSISGRLLEDTFVDKNPSERIMIGKLASNRAEKSFIKGYVENKQNQFTSIPSINTSFIVRKNTEGILYVKPRGLLFYNVKPDYQKTVEYALETFSEKYNYYFSDINELVLKCEDKFQIPNTFRMIRIENFIGKGIPIRLSSITESSFNLQDAISEKLSVLQDQIRDEIRICKLSRCVLSDLASKEAFEKIATCKDEVVNAHWLIDVFVNVKDEGDFFRVSLQMVNNTTLETNEVNGYLTEVFDAGMTVTGENIEFQPIALDYFKSNFRRKDSVYAVSENTAVEFDCASNSIVTENVPRYYQYRLKTRSDYNEYISFKSLLSDPLGNLAFIASEMDKDFEKCETEYSGTRFDTETAKRQFRMSLSEYRQEIDRFKKGIEHIRYKDFVRKSFSAMNRAFQTILPGDVRIITGWRLFQIVFIVSLIPEVIRCEYKNDSTLIEADDDVANLLFFPTGGGKTEAFLGVCIFSMFFDRFRGKNYGITAFLKYPLRLLAVQQLDRILSVIIKANKVKNEISEIKATRKFEVGFYVGKQNTPNEIKESEPLSSRNEYEIGKSNNAIVEADGDTLDEWYRFIDACPVCGKKMVHVRFNKDRWKLEHICTNSECSAGVLPILIVDSEIYRYLPSIVVSTIDKMAMVGISNEFKSLFGQVQSKCAVHGFSTTSKCLCRGCTETPQNVDFLKDPIPTLFIQDELHLVKESLGTFDAHYESFISYYAKDLVPPEQRKKIKYVGATATISMYQNHIQELYHMNGRRFPCDYPSSEIGRDFYSYTDESDISRIIFGFAPYGKSITDGMWQSVYEMRLVIFHFMSQAEEFHKLVEKGFNGTIEDYKDMLFNYWVELVYNNRKQDATELENAFQNQGNNLLQAKGIPLFQIKSMTSDVDFQDVRKTLFDIQENHRNLESTNLILATSTISHGVDEDSFNSMYFFGMPNNNAEYIQAYSRVGRKYTGIVIDIIRLMRIRDRSYLKNFVEFHKNKDDLIESVPINRWARNAIYSTLPGILAALLHQYYAVACRDNFMFMNSLKKALRDGRIEIDDVVDKTIASYGCNSQEKLSEIYADTIKEEVTSILEGIMNRTLVGVTFTSEAIGKCSHWNKQPMKSLRDTDEQIEIDLRRNR